MSTYGSSNAPSQNTINYDSILSTSLFNYQRTLTDNISKSNVLFYKIQENGLYEGVDGGVAMQVSLMYNLGNGIDTYSDYDTLNTDPTDGLTSAFFDWRQIAAPITISRLEERKNSTTDRIMDLLKVKIMQAELGLKEFFIKQILQGSAAVLGTNGNLRSNYQSQANGSLGIDPLNLLIDATPARNAVVGNLNGSTATWWQNQALASALTTANKATDFLFEFDTFINNCSKGPGGPPDCIFVDQTTFQLFRAAYFQVYRIAVGKNADYGNWDNILYNGVTLFWDEFVPNVGANTNTLPSGNANGTYNTANILDTTVANGGVAIAINTKFMGVKYDKETNFVATTFQKPVNQDARVAHILWMGNLVESNRRKMGVYYNIPRSLTWTI